MANIQPVTFTAHGNKRWQRFSSYAFAARTTMAPLMLSEVRSAASAFPIGFVKHQGNCFPAAILGLDENVNLFVNAQGEWIGAYIPGAFRVWPFSLVHSERGEKLLCVDEDSGLVGDGPDGERFFDEDETPSATLQEVSSFIARLAQEREPSLAACAALEAAGVLQPWTSVVRIAERQWSMEGFMRIDENALDKLRTSTLASLHKAGALALAYAQLHSVAQLAFLGQLAEARLAAASPGAQPASA